MDNRTLQEFIRMAADLQRESVTLRARTELIRAAMQQLSDEEEKLFIELRYFRGLRMQSVANAMHLSRTSAYRVQISAHKHVQELMDAGMVKG